MVTRSINQTSDLELTVSIRFKLRLPSDDVNAPDGDTERFMLENAIRQGVLALPGSAFSPCGEKTPYVRAAFSLLKEEEVNEALRRLGNMIRAGYETNQYLDTRSLVPAVGA